MSAEYSGKVDEDKTVPILPRPLRNAKQRLRAQNLTGDPDGFRSTDNRFFWQGLNRDEEAARDNALAAKLARDEAIDEMWY